MYEDPKSKISQLEKILDAQEDRVTGKTKRHTLRDREITVKSDWEDSDFTAEKERESLGTPTPTGPSLAVKILVGSLIFFVVALGVVAYKFFGGSNIISGDNIEVTVKAPISISGGETLAFEVEIKNNNNISLLGVDFGVAFPSGAREALDTSQPAKRVQEFLGDISPGQSLKKNLSVVLFGAENEKKDINLTLEYKIAGSNSLFNKTKSVSILISSAPITIVVSGPKEVNTNQSVDFTVDISSNSPSVMKSLLLKVEYPFGFSFSNSDPKTFSKNNLWLIGDLESGAKRTIKFSGVLNGQEGEERGFNFSIGSQSKSDSLAIDVPFSSSFSSVTIRRPFVSADITLNEENSSEYVSVAGSEVEAIINWQNNLPYAVSDVSIVVKISGNAVDKSSIEVDEGYYQSIDNSIIFSKTTNGTFASLDPGELGVSKFTFKSFGPNSVTGAGLSNPTIILNISVNGKRVDYQSNQTDVLFSDSRKIKISANPQLFAKALYYTGPFKNTGPIPAKAEQETTYTITWTVTNPLNNLSNVKVSTILPLYIKWLNVISPNSEKLDYNGETGLLTWNIGNVSAGAGTIVPAEEVSFQISFLPSVSQIGTIPNLTGDAEITAKDNFTLTMVSNFFTALNTRLSNDPYFQVDAEKVVQ